MFIAGWVVGMGIPVEVKQCCHLYEGTAVAAGAHIIMAVGILMVRDLLRDSSLVWNSGFRFLVALFVFGASALMKIPACELCGPIRMRETWKFTHYC